MNSNEIIDIDLPNLKSITLGFLGLRGTNESKNCSLTMRSIIELIRND